MIPRTVNSPKSAPLKDFKDNKGDRALISAQNVLIAHSNLVAVQNGGFHTHTHVHVASDRREGR